MLEKVFYILFHLETKDSNAGEGKLNSCALKAVQPLWKSVHKLLKKFSIELFIQLPHSLLYAQKILSQYATELLACPCLLVHNSVYIWPTGKWIKKMWCIYLVELYSTIQKIRNHGIFRNSGRNYSMLSQIRQSDRHHIFSHM